MSDKKPLSLRLIMTGKEVGSIIGKGGEIIHNIREVTGSKIHISDGSLPERIVCLSGFLESLHLALSLIINRLENESSGKGVSLRLIIPSSQCGSLIGKGGSKIKELREVSGASIVVASEMLPQSTERCVTISGNKESLLSCISTITSVLLECPPKTSPIAYHPKTAVRTRNSRDWNSFFPAAAASSALLTLASLASSQLRDKDLNRGSNSNYEMTIPNDSIGCIIGKGGSKIAEIRQISGAMVRISKSEQESSREESRERIISISGNSDSVALAKSLINMSLDLHKASLESRGGSESRSRNHDRSSPFQLKPEAWAALASLTSLGGSLLANNGLHRSRNNGVSTLSRSRDDDRRENKRSKFAPY